MEIIKINVNYSLFQ